MNTNKKSAIIGLFLLAGISSLNAANGTWTVDASGTWSDTTKWLGGVVADGSGFTADFSTINITADRTVTLDTGHTLTTLKFGDTLPDHNWILSGANTLTLGTTPTINVINQTATISSVIAGTAFTKIGLGTLDLNGSAVNTFTGTLAHNAGTFTEDFSNLGTPVNLINSGVILSMAGGTLNINGAASGATSQTFASTTLNPGENVVNATVNGASTTLSLGALTVVKGATVEFSTTGTIQTTTAGQGTTAAPYGLVGSTTGNAVNQVGYATYGTSDWATTDPAGAPAAGTSPYTIGGIGSVTGGYSANTATAFAAGNDDLTLNITGISANSSTTTVRFNTPTATSINNNNKYAGILGILVTPNMGANNTFYYGATSYMAENASAVGNAYIWQNNPSAFFEMKSNVGNNRDNTADPLILFQSGPGTVVYTGNATSSKIAYYGQTYLNGGYTVIPNDAGLGDPTTDSQVNLNGGTIVGANVTLTPAGGSTANDVFSTSANSFSLDNGSTAKRAIVLGGNGGGLAATAGTTMTVDGVISGAAGTGPLTIGIPASAANGNTAGLLPGTGTGTANTTAVNANGTVNLTYPNGANGNTFYGGAIILGGATLSINSQYALGGANYGGLTFNNGTLQYNSTLATGAAGSALDISGAPVAFVGNGTIDENGQTVAYASSIGSGGSGSLTVANSGVAGAGALLLNGGSSYTGGTTVNSGATFGGTGTLVGNVTWNSGAYATFAQGSPMTISGTATLNGTTVNVIASGLTTGTYTLMTASGGIIGGSTVNSTPGGSGIVASGYAGTVSISGNTVILAVAQLGVAATWTDANADQNWATGGNWTGGTAPHNPGDAATFGSGGVGLPVILNQNESVGGLTFSNASSYIVSGSDTLTLNNTIHPIPLSVMAGTSNAINAAVSLNGNVTATISLGASFAFGSNIVNQSSAEALAVSGGGMMVLAGNNSYGPSAGTVGTTLGGAILQVGNNNALGAGDVNVTANSTLQSGAPGLTLPNNVAVAVGHTVTADNNGNVITFGGVISGSGALAATSAGTVSLSGVNNTYAGGTTINAGILSIATDGTTAGGAGSLGAVPATATLNNLIFNGGDLLATATLTLHTNRGTGIGSTSPANTATTTALLDASAGQSLIIEGIIAPAGNSGMNNLTVNSGVGNTGTIVLAGANTFNGSNVISAGFELLSNSLALQDCTLNYNNQGGLLDLGTNTAVTLGGLVGAQNLTLTNDLAAPVALTVGNNNVSSTYLGNLGDNSLVANLIKNGTGTITIGSGANGGATYTGVTTVNNGTLVLGGNTTMPSITGNLDISGITGASSLIMADTASATFGGKIEVCYDGGAGNPGAGMLTVQNNATLNAATFAFGNGSRTPNGCAVTVQNNGTLSVSGIFDLNDNIGGTAQNNVLNLNGGTLAAGNFISSDAAAIHQATINFNGGVLEANASDSGGSTFLPALTGLTVNVLSNGVTINPNGNTITISPAMSGAGGLTNIGTGTLSLVSPNTYAGATFVANGATLNVINTTGSATGTNTVTINSGGTLEGTGIIAGSVTWLSGALAGFSTGSTPTPLTAGAVILNNNVVTVNVPGSALSVGNYTLMNYAAAGSTGTFNPTPVLTGSGLVSGVQATVSTAGGTVTLLVTPNVVSDVWDVDADGNWTDAAKWSSNPTVPGNPGDAAELGAGSALRTVTMNANESLGYLQLTNANSFVVANGGHTLTMDNSGAGAYITVGAGTANAVQTPVALNDNTTVSLLSGAVLTVSSSVANSPSVNETLTLTGAGKLVLGNANSYGPAGSGVFGTVLGGGTLQVGNSHSLGAGDVNITGASSLQSGSPGLVLTNNFSAVSGMTFTLNDNGNVFTLGGVVGGGAIMTKAGSGTLILTNNNNYTGVLVVTNGTLILSGDNSGASGTVTNSAILQLANANGIGSGSILALNNNSILQLRADADTTFSPASLALQNTSDTLNFDARPLTSATGHSLTLNGGLAFLNNSSQTITVTGNSTYTLSLGAITLTTSTSHNPSYSLNFGTSPSGAKAVIAGITSGNWGDFINFYGGGNVTVTGNLANTSNGSLDLFVNDGSTVTLQGSTVKTLAGDAYRYSVQNGTLILDSSTALLSDTTGAGLNTSYFFLGTATNAYYGAAIVPAAGVLVTNNNAYNAAVYLGDANNLGGGLSVSANVTNIISDGDATLTNTGTFTVGGQNTSGINTYANPIILGWTANKGKGVSLVSAPGGEVDFMGNILANGTDTSAGITVGNVAFTGTVKLYGTNTYGGPTIVSNGVLALSNNGFDASINHSSSIYINTGASLDVSGRSDTTLQLGTSGFNQTLRGNGSLTGGNLNVGTAGTLAPGSAIATGTLTISGSTTLGGATLMKLNNTGSPTNDKLVCSTVAGGGTLIVTNIGPALVAGNTFQLFSAPVSGFSSVSLPATANGYNYTWNNQIAANGSISVATAVLAINTNAATANFKATPAGNSLQFNWAPDHKGWQLYTNAVGLAATGSWFPVAGSASTTNETITIDPTKANVFFELKYP